MKIAQFENADGLCVGIQTGRSWMNFSKAEALYYLLRRNLHVEPVPTIQQLLEAGEFNVADFRRVIEFAKKNGLTRALELSGQSILRAPVLRPPKIIALGLNYVLHAKEGSFEVPKEPIIFVKAGSSVIGPGDTVRIPRGLGRMDHEVELAVVIGASATRVRKKDAHRFIAGYTICNDITARTLQTKDINNRHPWFRSKSLDTFTPLGPWIVTADEIRRPVRLALECRVNGKRRQRANTKDLVFDIPTIIETVTRFITLEPGDVISTGTPAGIGPIVNGDSVVCRVQGIGELRNPVRWK